jgi:hypothetical protein
MKTYPPMYELRFHWLRLGSRLSVGKLFGMGHETVCRLLPVNDLDLFMRGQMINIGGILAKRCLHCGAARELDRFYADDARASGCRETCDICREAAGVTPQRHPTKRRIN